MNEEVLSKKELAIRFGVSHNTVTRTLKACGISTRKTRYTTGEVETFAKGRELFTAGYTVQEVEEYFRIPTTSPPPISF